MKPVTKKIGNYMMCLRPNEGGIHSNLMKISKRGGEREPGLLHIMRQELENGMVCMDVGANIGYVTLLMADKIGPDGIVYAIEPDPSNIELLNINMMMNGYSDRVNIFNMGMSNKCGESNFYVGKSSNLGGMAKTKSTRDKSIKVKVDTITNFCETNKVPGLIKMDIEGHEVEVLEGMCDLIKKKSFPCKIVMELHPVYYSKDHSLEHWMKKFLKYGFKTKYIVSAGVVQPDLFKIWGYDPVKSFKSNRGLYDSFSDGHMLISCCYENKQWIPSKNKYSPKIARFVMIERS